MTPTPTGFITALPARGLFANAGRARRAPGRAVEVASVIAAAPRTQMPSLHSRTTMSADVGQAGRQLRRDGVARAGRRNARSSPSPAPEMITLGGANRVMRLAMAKPSASPAAASTRDAALVAGAGALQQQGASPRPARIAPSWLAAAQQRLGLGEHRSLRREIAEPAAAVARTGRP